MSLGLGYCAVQCQGRQNESGTGLLCSPMPMGGRMSLGLGYSTQYM